MIHHRKKFVKMSIWFTFIFLLGIGSTAYVIQNPEVKDYFKRSSYIEELIDEEQPIIEQGITDEERERSIEGIISSPEFQSKIRQEAERIYYLQIREEADTKLLELQEGGFSGETISSVKLYLNGYNSELAYYAEEIVKLPRWIEALAITGKETSFCLAGVGDTKNNCGAIKNSQTGKFKVYATIMDSFEDVTILLQKERYADKTIAQMNGIYCVDEDNIGNRCTGWDSDINRIVGQIHLALK